MRRLQGLWTRFAPLAALIAAIWIVHILNIMVGGALSDRFGLIPRRPEGLDGVVAMPFLHGSLEHLSANTVPLLVLGGLILLLWPDRFWSATLICVLLGGAITWLLARQHNHIGASGLVFGWFGFLVALGVFERSLRAIAGAAVALALYGAPTVLGLVPTDDAVSWDGHAAGLAAGVAAAWSARRAATRPRRRGRLRGSAAGGARAASRPSPRATPRVNRSRRRPRA